MAQNDNSTEMRTLLECPVCVQTFKNPKSLPCGHSVCLECCRNLNKQRVNLMCPVCRSVCSISADDLPMNFGLRDLVQHHVEVISKETTSSTKPFVCARCEKCLCEDDCWLCTTCRSIVCCNCALKHHKTHNLQEMKKVVAEKDSKLVEWRSNLDNLKREVVQSRQEIDKNRLRISGLASNAYASVRTKGLAHMETTSKAMERRISAILARSNELNTARCVIDEIAGKETDLTTVPALFEALKNEEKAMIEKQKEICATYAKLEDLLNKLAPSTPCSAARPQVISSLSTTVAPVNFLRMSANNNRGQNLNLTINLSEASNINSQMQRSAAAATDLRASAASAVARLAALTSVHEARTVVRPMCVRAQAANVNASSTTSSGHTVTRATAQPTARSSSSQNSCGAARPVSTRLVPAARPRPLIAARLPSPVATDDDESDDGMEVLASTPSEPSTSTGRRIGHATAVKRRAVAMSSDSSDSESVSSDNERRAADSSEVDCAIHFRHLAGGSKK